MSYCRWSSDDYQCDLYVYEGLDGWMIHIAGRRWVLAEAPPEPIPPTELTTAAGVERLIDRDQQLMAILSRSHLAPIGLPHDGQTLIADSPGECADLLAVLAAEGYRLPNWVIGDLRAEQADRDSDAQALPSTPPQN